MKSEWQKYSSSTLAQKFRSSLFDLKNFTFRKFLEHSAEDRKKIKDILKVAILNHNNAYENHPAISNITSGPVTGKDIRLKEEFYQSEKSRSVEQLEIQKKVKTVLESYDNNFENILVQLNKTWSNSDLMSVMLAWYR